MGESNDELKKTISSLPEEPGIYQYFDKSGQIIYVGKAKNIKKRVSSYFNKTQENNKTRVLVKSIVRIKYIVVSSELDALLLENNLIKTYQPKYNIQLKDDKTFPWIVVTNESFPRVFSTRQKELVNGKFYGPYPNVKAMNALLGLIREMYPLRTCSLDLSAKKLAEKRYKTCLEFHIGKCLGPCVEKQTEEEYDTMIDEIELLLKGKTYSLIQALRKKMLQLSESYRFEDAHKLKLTIEQIEKYRSKSTIVSSKLNDVDVFCYLENENQFIINYLVIQEGAIIHGYTAEVQKKLNENETDLINFVLPELREKFQSKSKEVIVEKQIDSPFTDFYLFVPQKGEKKELIELSKRNIFYFKKEREKRALIQNPQSTKDRILERIRSDFKLTKLPIHMECFDNSNFQGTNAVSACVVFKNGKPSKKDYRHFNIKTVEGPDDFASMREVVYRRYKRLLDEGQTLPQLVIIDGGKGQLSAAMESIEKLGLRGEMAIVGIAKKLEEIFFPGDQYPIYLDKRSESLKTIQFMRNEAHRFGITHHRDKRSKNAINSELDQISGIGEKTKQLLLSEFKSISNIKKVGIEELIKKIGQSKATILFNYFKEVGN
ncbi:MAG: excinuclease ABC subunit UvrC [Crocinitomicaceae bacterium]|jgi:excinuclease ABC subunit C